MQSVTVALYEEGVLPRRLYSLLQQICSRLLCEFFSVANVRRFLSLNRMNVISFRNCFEQDASLAWQFASVSSLSGVSLNTSKQDHGEKWSARRQIVLFVALNDEFTAGLTGLVPVPIIVYCGHILFNTCALWSVLAVLSVGAIFEN